MEEINEILKVSKEKARTPPIHKVPTPNKKKPKSLFANIPTKMASVDIEPIPCNDDVDSILPWLASSLAAAEAILPLEKGAGATGECKILAATLAKKCSDIHFDTPEGLAALKALLATTKIDTNAIKAHTILSVILQALATRDILITNGLLALPEK